MGLPISAAWAIGLLVGINLVFLSVRALVAASLLKRVVTRLTKGLHVHSDCRRPR